MAPVTSGTSRRVRDQWRTFIDMIVRRMRAPSHLVRRASTIVHERSGGARSPAARGRLGQPRRAGPRRPALMYGVVFLVVVVTHFQGFATILRVHLVDPTAKSILHEGNADLDEYADRLARNRFYRRRVSV